MNPNLATYKFEIRLLIKSSCVMLNCALQFFKARTVFEDVKASTVFDVVHDTEYRKKWDKDMIDLQDICKLSVNNSVGYYAGPDKK